MAPLTIKIDGGCPTTACGNLTTAGAGMTEESWVW